MSTPVHAVAMPLNTRVMRVAPVALVVTSVSRRAVRATQHVTTFSDARMTLIACRVVL